MLEVVFILPDEEGNIPCSQALTEAGIQVSTAVAPANNPAQQIQELASRHHRTGTNARRVAGHESDPT